MKNKISELYWNAISSLKIWEIKLNISLTPEALSSLVQTWAAASKIKFMRIQISTIKSQTLCS